MGAIKKILVTTDFSTFSAVALEHANSIATIHRAEIHLLHIVEEHIRIGFRKSEENEGTRSFKAAETARQNMTQFVYTNVDEYIFVKQVIRFGHPADEIVRYAREEAIDLIVIATHGRSGLAHMIIGSVAEQIIRRSPIPVLAVKPEAVLEHLITEEDVAHDLHMEHLK